MAQFSRLTTITASTYVTAQTLHDLIEQCTITNLNTSDIGGTNLGIQGVVAQLAQPSPSTSPFWLQCAGADDISDPVFRVYAKPWDIWLACGPDRFELPFRNASGGIVPLGSLVVPAGPSEFTVASGVSCNALGFLQSTCASGAVGPVMIFGFGYALYASCASGAHFSFGDSYASTGGARNAGALSAINFHSTNALHTQTATSGVVWGAWLATSVSGISIAPGAVAAFPLFMFGPRANFN